MVSSEHLWIQIHVYSTFFIFFYRDAVDERAAKEKKRQIKKYLMIGAAAVGGGTLIGVTGGLAAPLVIGRYLMRETFVTKDCLFITTCLTVIIFVLIDLSGVIMLTSYWFNERNHERNRTSTL